MNPIKRILLVAGASLSLLSCRSLVLEDRSWCPSFLYYEIINGNLFQGYDSLFTAVYSHPGGSRIAERSTTVGEVLGGRFYVVVRGTEAVRGYGLTGWKGLTREGDSWTVPIGEEFPPLYRFAFTEGVREESFTVPVELVKEHARVTVQFVGIETFTEAGGRFPFDVVVRSGTAGIDPMTGGPVMGPFEFAPREGTAGRFEFTLPRQGDRSLTMELYGREGVYNRSGFENAYDLHDILLKLGGVTWTEKNLPDVYIEVDYQQTTVTVSVTPWGTVDLDYEF